MIKNGVLTVKRITIDTLIIVLALITPFLRYYELPVASVSFETLIAFLLLFLSGVAFISRIKDNIAVPEMRSANKWYAFFLLWLIFVTGIYELFTDIGLHSSAANYNANALLMPLVRALIIFFILSGKIKSDGAIDVYSFLAELVIAVYILQWILLLVGLRVSFKLPFDYDKAWAFLRPKVFGMQKYPTALFSEKSHFCEYVCPYIAMCLYSDRLVPKNRIKKAVFHSVCVVSTASGNGIIIVALIWLMYFAFFGKFKKEKNRIVLAVVGVVMLIGMYNMLRQIPRFDEMFERLFVDKTGSEFTSSKADYRIYRGLDIFTKLPIWAQLTGVGYQHMFMFSQKYDIVSQFDYSWKMYEYFSAVGMVLLYSGAIGAFFCFRHFFALYKHKSKAAKGLIIITTALWFSTEMLFRTTHIVYILLIVAAIVRENATEKAREEL